MNEDEFVKKAWSLLNSGKYEKALKGKQVAVIGAGGAGGNIVEDMALKGLKEMEGVYTIVVNSDDRLLEEEKYPHVNKKVHIGKNIAPEVKGAGGSRKLARKMVEEAKESLDVLISPYPVVVLVGGIGGGTGSELLLEMSRMSVRKGKMTLAIPVLPFSIEGPRRRVASAVIEELRETGAMIVEIDNDSLLRPELMGLPVEQTFGILNRVIMKKIEELHASARKALMDEIVKDIMANMSAEEELQAAAAMPAGPEKIAIPAGIGMVPEAITAAPSDTPAEVFAKSGSVRDIPPAAQ